MDVVSSGLRMDLYPLGIKDCVFCIHAQAIVKQESLLATVLKTIRESRYEKENLICDYATGITRVDTI